MPMTICVDCKNEISSSALACPNCGKPNSNTPSKERSVSILLGIGIFLLPLIFVWFTLRKGHTTKAKILSFSWLVLGLVAGVFQGCSETESASYSPTSLEADSPTPPIIDDVHSPSRPTVLRVDIGSLLSAYEDNEVRADNMLKGKQILVSGIIGRIKKDFMDNLYVTLGTGADYETPKVQAFFDDSMNIQLGELRKGDKLTVICRVDGLMMNVLAKECIIYEP